MSSCPVCDGTGRVPVEEPDHGVPAWLRPTDATTVCSYCHGSRESSWVARNVDHHHNRVGLIGMVAFGTMVYLMAGSPGLPGGLRWLLWPSAFVIFLVCWIKLPRPAKGPMSRQEAVRKNAKDSFTTPAEQVAGAAFLIGTAVKAHHDMRHKK